MNNAELRALCASVGHAIMSVKSDVLVSHINQLRRTETNAEWHLRVLRWPPSNVCDVKVMRAENRKNAVRTFWPERSSLLPVNLI